ncbi:hypothetical protein PIB30_051501 [Stylosanthes scabra]|uniref:Uncharacterized protein n=1 Tax=Stylosanthes scabra TaxID=79078 RepID=A0ABU6RHY5_9FABA|nr:hypothetical protein [Stylosanthes scabra]
MALNNGASPHRIPPSSVSSMDKPQTGRPLSFVTPDNVHVQYIVTDVTSVATVRSVVIALRSYQGPHLQAALANLKSGEVNHVAEDFLLFPAAADPFVQLFFRPAVAAAAVEVEENIDSTNTSDRSDSKEEGGGGC